MGLKRSINPEQASQIVGLLKEGCGMDLAFRTVIKVSTGTRHLYTEALREYPSIQEQLKIKRQKLDGSRRCR